MSEFTLTQMVNLLSDTGSNTLISTLSTQQPTYSVNLLHYFRSSVSKQRFVPKTKLNIGKRAFSVAVPTI